MRPELSRGTPCSGVHAGSNWRGVGRVEVHADMHAAGLAPGAVLVVNFDRRSVDAGGRYLVTFDGWPELLQFKRFPRGLRARIGGRWVDVARDDLRDMDVIGRLVKISEAGV